MSEPGIDQQGMLLHFEHVLAIVRRQSGEGFVEQLLKAAKLPSPWDPEKVTHLTHRDEAELIRLTAELSGDPAYPTRIGLNYSAVSSVPGYVSRSSRTLRSAIMRSKRYTRFSVSALDYELRETPKLAILRIWTTDPAVDRNFYHREFGVFVVLSIIRFILARNVQPVSVTFRHKRTSGADAIQRAAGCKVIWDTPEDGIRLPPETLEMEIPTYDPRLRDLLMEHGEDLLDRIPDEPSCFRDRVQRLIVNGFGDGAPSADHVAQELGMSRRTMTRRLSDEGQTYRAVMDEVRLDLAHSYLHDTRLGLAEIAFRLGYADQAAFTTAFKRWTGKTPSQDRHEH